MGRSVSVPSNASTVCYVPFAGEDPDDFQDMMENVSYGMKEAFPSLNDCHGRLGREDLVFLRNRFAQIGISEYCGLVAIWVVPFDDGDKPELAAHWCGQIEKGFLKVVADCCGPLYNKIGTASNGESFYRRA